MCVSKSMTLVCFLATTAGPMKRNSAFFQESMTFVSGNGSKICPNLWNTLGQFGCPLSSGGRVRSQVRNMHCLDFFPIIFVEEGNQRALYSQHHASSAFYSAMII